MAEFSIDYVADPKWQGLDVQNPADLIARSASPSFSNFTLRNAALTSRPPFVKVFQPPQLNEESLGAGSFIDLNGVTHSFAFTTLGLWQLEQTNNIPNKNPWTFIGQPQLIPGIPVSWQAFVNNLYYTNGSPTVAQWDGVALEPSIISFLADGVSSVGGLFLFELASRLVLAYVVQNASGQITKSAVAVGGTGYNVGDTATIGSGIAILQVTKAPAGIVTEYTITNQGVGYTVAAGVTTNPTSGTGTGLTINITAIGNSIVTMPQTVWWSANGLPNVWDPTINTSAGFNPLLDTPDIITGVMALGEFALIFRTNGITQVSPTGSGLVPFEFDHMWASNKGIGNVYPFSLAQYGSFGVFISTEQVFQVSVNSFQEIGKGARDAIMNDLANSTSNPVAYISSASPFGYVYLTYNLCIPLGTFTRIYKYSLEDKNWQVWDMPGLLVTSQPYSVWR